MSFLALLKLIPWWAYAAAALLAIIGLQVLEVSHYKSDEARYKAADAAYASAQVTNLATIASLQSANAKWASAANDAQDNAKTYAAAIAQYEVQQNNLSTAASKNLKVYYASHPLARAWSATPVDPGVVEQLRANAGN